MSLRRLMDTTKTYIKMSLEAWGHEEPEVGVLFSTQSEEIMVTDEGRWYAQDGGGFIPLKTQDQLQEMVGDYNRCLDLLDREFNADRSDFGVLHYSYSSLGILPLFSMEQLWLALVEKGKYNKVWNGENWIRGGKEGSRKVKIWQ